MSFLKPANYYSKEELRDLINRLKQGDKSVEYELVVFTLADSKGRGHGYAQARICRYLKNHPPDATLQAKLVEKIGNRLATGDFSQQFKIQLKMAIRFDPEAMLAIAYQLLQEAEKEYVRRYARWVCDTIQRQRDQSHFRCLGESSNQKVHTISRQRKIASCELNTIKTILLQEWDPLDIGTNPHLHDEYDQYAMGVFKILSNGGLATDVLRYLESVEVSEMGLKQPSEPSLQQVSNRILQELNRAT